MKYTLWLNGHLLGETRLEHRNPQSGQRVGGLNPTPYGAELLPGMCGFLRTAAALKQAMMRLGVTNPDTDVERTMELIDLTPEGERFSELVKSLSRLELRDVGGERAAFHTVIVTDVRELGELSPSIDVDAELAQGTPRFIISATPINFSAVTRAVSRGARLRVQLEPN